MSTYLDELALPEQQQFAKLLGKMHPFIYGLYLSIYHVIYHGINLYIYHYISGIYHDIYCSIYHVILHGIYIDIYPVWNTENLFHYKAEQSKYSIKPEDYGKKPLFVVDKDSNTYLNEFFFYVFSHVGRWQCLRELSVASLDQAVSLSTAGYCELSKSPSGPGLEASPVISKKTVAYFESFLGAAPFPRILKDPRLDARVDKFYANAMIRLSKVSDKDFVRYIERKMLAWYRRFPPKDDPDNGEKEKTKEADASMEAGGPDAGPAALGRREQGLGLGFVSTC